MVLIGRPHSEARLLAVGHAVEARLDLSDRTLRSHPRWGLADARLIDGACAPPLVAAGLSCC